MHDLNLLPETETVRRQSRLLFLAAIGITVASGIWISSTHFSNQQIKTDLQQTLASTEAEIKAVPPLTRQVQDLTARLQDRDETLAHLSTLPSETAAAAEAISRTLVTFADDEYPSITLDRITAQRTQGGHLTLSIKGRAIGGQPIQDRFQRLQTLGLLQTSPTIKQEADGRYSFDANLELELEPTTRAEAP